MATTRIIPLHAGKGRTVGKAISDIIDYVKNPDKTDHGRLITSYQCDSRVADAQFLLDKQTYVARTGRVRGKDENHLHRRRELGQQRPLRPVGRRLHFVQSAGGPLRPERAYAPQENRCAGRPAQGQSAGGHPGKTPGRERCRICRWAKVFNLKQMAQTLNYLSEYGLLDYADLETKTTEATARYNALSSQIKAAEKRMAEIAVLRTHIVNYAKTRETYVAYRKDEVNPYPCRILPQLLRYKCQQRVNTATAWKEENNGSRTPERRKWLLSNDLELERQGWKTQRQIHQHRAACQRQ